MNAPSFPITKKAEPPKRPPVRRSVHLYPFEKLEVGDMFFLPGRKSFSSYAYIWSEKLNRTFRTRQCYCRLVRDESTKQKIWKTCEQMDEGATLGVAVFRVEFEPIKKREKQ